MPIKLDDFPEFPPHVSTPKVAFGTTEYLPVFEELPEEYQNQKALGCRLAETIFFDGGDAAGKEAASMYSGALILAEPPQDYDFGEEEKDALTRFHRCIGAHLRSWKPKHKHKIAGVGYMIDQWVKQSDKPNG